MRLLSSLACVVALCGCGDGGGPARPADGTDGGQAADGGDGGQQPDDGGTFFDPLAAGSMAQLFETASSAIAPVFPQHELSFTEARGIPQGSAPTYEQTPFRWSYTIAATDISGGPNGAVKGVGVTWPGWTATIRDESPMGAYLPAADVGATIPLSLGPLFAAIADDGVNPGDCPISADGTPPGGILLHGTISYPAGAHWSWNIWCDGRPVKEFFFDTQGNLLE